MRPTPKAAKPKPKPTPEPEPEAKSELTEPILEAALMWHGRGYNVTPNTPLSDPKGKHPSVLWKIWQTKRIAEQKLLSRVWRKKFAAGEGLGCITGYNEEMGQGVVVIENDGAAGAALLAKYEKSHGPLPKTLTIKSGSGRGLHYHFKHPGGGVRVTTRANPLISVDVKGDGGYAVLPPSLHKSGGRYEIVDDAPLADLPSGLVEFIEARAAEAKAAAKAKKAETARPTKDGSSEPDNNIDEIAARFQAQGEIEVEQLLAGMTYNGEGVEGSNVHETQLAAIRGLMRRGVDRVEAVKTILEATRKVGPESWDWAKEERELFGAWDDWATKSENSSEADDSAESADDNSSATGSTKSSKSGIKFEPYDFPDERTLKRWDFLCGTYLLRGAASCTASRGGTGKTSKSIVEALAMASGKRLLYDDVTRPLRVLIINLEDNRNAMEKRIAAAMRHHKLKPEDIGDRLFLKAKGELKFKIVTQDSHGRYVVNQKFIDEMVRVIREKKIDVLIVDPLIKTHAVRENDNTGMDLVMDGYSEIADRGDCAVGLCHHVRKGDGSAMTVDDLRGAGGIHDALRALRMEEPMTAQEAMKLKINDRRQYFRSFSGKLTFAPPPSGDESQWFHFVSVPLMNGPSDLIAADGGNGGDNVGVVEAWQHPGQTKQDLPTETIEAVKKEVGGEKRWRKDPRSTVWVGHAVAKALKLDVDEDREQIKGILKGLVQSGVLMDAIGPDRNREMRVFVIAPEELSR